MTLWSFLNPRVATLAAFVLLLSISSALKANEIVLLTEQRPPFNMPGDKASQPIGMSTELVEMAMASIPVPYKIEVVSWKRAYETALKEKDTCAYSTTLTDDRKPLFTWIGPLYLNDWVLITKEGRPTPKSLEDVKGNLIGASYGDATAEYLLLRGFKVDQNASNDMLNIRKLDAGRIDYWVVGRARFRYLRKIGGIKGLVESIKVTDTELYLACNKSISSEVVDRLSKSIERLQKNGTAEVIRKKYE